MSKLRLMAVLAGAAIVSVIAYEGTQEITRDKSVVPASTWKDSEHLFPATKYLFPAQGDMLNVYGLNVLDLEKGDFDILKVEGVFPKCRYFTVAMHRKSLTGEAFNFIDREIVPDEGHVNPFVVGNERLKDQRYTVYFVKQGVEVPPSLKNVRYIPTDFGQVVIGTRNYRADDDTPMAEVARPFPVVTALHKDMTPGIAPAAAGVPYDAMNYLDHDRYEAAYDRHMAFQRGHGNPNSVDFLYYGGDDQGANNDTRYLFGMLGDDFSNVAVVGIPKAPNHEMTRHGEAFEGGKNIRYWSFCHGEGRMGMVHDCVNDDRMKLNDDGSVTLVIGPESIRRSVEAAEINFLPWTRNRTLYKPVMWLMYRGNRTYDPDRLAKKSTLLFRQILADPEWDGAILKKADRVFEWSDASEFNPTDADKAEVMLGDYGPRGFVIDKDVFLEGLKRGDFSRAFSSHYERAGRQEPGR